MAVHFLMEVDMAEALNKSQEQMVQDLRTELREQNIRYSGVRRVGDQVLVFRDEADQARLVLANVARMRILSDHRQKRPDLHPAGHLSEAKVKEVKKYALEQNITIIRNRVNELGWLSRWSSSRAASVSWSSCRGSRTPPVPRRSWGDRDPGVPYGRMRLPISSAAAGRVPPTQLYRSQRSSRGAAKRVILTGNHIVDAQSGLDEYSRPQVNISLDGQGGNKMANFTKDNVGKSWRPSSSSKPVGSLVWMASASSASRRR